MMGIACEAGSCPLSQLELLAQLRMTFDEQMLTTYQTYSHQYIDFHSSTHEAAGRGCHMENSARRELSLMAPPSAI